MVVVVVLVDAIVVAGEGKCQPRLRVIIIRDGNNKGGTSVHISRYTIGIAHIDIVA